MALRSPSTSLSAWAALSGAVLLASCNLSPVDNRFDDTGELIALSGSDAGPQAACHTCHGIDGAGDGDLVPRIAGLNSGYLVRQLGFFADGQRSHSQMSWLAGRLSSEERLAVAQYYTDKGFPAKAPRRKSIEGTGDGGEVCLSAEARRLYHEGARSCGLESCASCHGADGLGEGQGNPSLIGQSAAYLEKQLRSWRSGERYGDPQGVMHDAASTLREDEITPLAEYIAYGLGPSRRPEPRAGCP